MTRVLIVQPYIPQYRVPFFQGLTEALAGRGIELAIAAGNATGAQAERRDAGELESLIQLDERRIGRGQRSLLLRKLGNVVDGADLIVLEQARRNLEVYPLLYLRSPAPVALWGHGKTSTRNASPWEHRWLDSVTRRADWFFAYTEEGRHYMVGRGFPAEHISVVHNTTDTARLRSHRDAITTTQRLELQRSLRLTDGRTALFLGALDSSKRIGFLLAAAEALATELPGFTLVVAGDGPLRQSVEGVAGSVPWLRYVGPAVGVEKAHVASVADVMLNPGRVGLTVVDSFALGVPMITTDWPWHAPEFAYIKDGVNGVVTADVFSAFVAATKKLLIDPVALRQLQQRCAASADAFRVDVMVDRFTDGILRALESRGSVHRQSDGTPTRGQRQTPLKMRS